MMFTARDVRKAASLVLSLVLLVLVYIHEISKKNPSSHKDLAPIPVRGWNFFLIFHICRLVPEQAIEQVIQLKKGLQCHPPAKNKPDNTKYHIIIVMASGSHRRHSWYLIFVAGDVSSWGNVVICDDVVPFLLMCVDNCSVVLLRTYGSVTISWHLNVREPPNWQERMLAQTGLLAKISQFRHVDATCCRHIADIPN